jgi:hypothetical protein
LELSVKAKAFADRIQALFGLGDWRIFYRVHREKRSENLGEVDTRLEYKTAVVEIHPRELANEDRAGMPWTQERLIIHELAEIVVEECLSALPECLREIDPMMKARDEIADRLTRITERLLKEGKKK